MGLFDWFRKKKEISVPLEIPPIIQEENSWLKNIQHKGGHLEAAFTQVISTVELEPPLQKRLFEIVHKNIDLGREQEYQFFELLHGSEWSWPALNSWQNYFRNLGAWPAMWIMNEELTKGQFGVITQEELCLRLPKPSLKKFLLDCDVPLAPKARKVEMVPLALRLSMEQIENFVTSDILLEARTAIKKYRDMAASRILCHTISMRFYKLRNYAQYLTTNRSEVTPLNHRPSMTTCPVEQIFCQKWVSGELVGIPPFFPGDRSSFIATHIGGVKTRA